MAWPYLPNTIKIVITYTVGGEVNINVLFARVTGGGGVTTTLLQDAADAVANAFDTYWKGNASSTAEVTNVEAFDWEAPNGQVRATTVTMPITGLETPQALPNNCALVVTNRTNFTGRSQRGRTYYPGMTETDVSGNTVTTTYMNNLLSNSIMIYNELILAGMSLIIYSLYANGAPRVTPVQTTVTGFTANSRVDTQRRRLPK